MGNCTTSIIDFLIVNRCNSKLKKRGLEKIVYEFYWYKGRLYTSSEADEFPHVKSGVLIEADNRREAEEKVGYLPKHTNQKGGILNVGNG
jgi:hypothetical protein